MPRPFISPSIQDGISPEHERIQLAYCADLIREACVALKISQRACATAQMLMHRFYTQVSMRIHSSVWTAGGCIMLSSKINGDSRNLRHIANILYDRMNEREQTEDYVGIENKIYRRPLDFYGAQGYDWKVSLIETERHILKELGFRLSVELPQKFVLIFVNTLRDKSDAPNWTQGGLHPYQKVLQTAWNYANDVLYSKLCVLEQPHAIACACISLGASQCELELPENWHVVFGCTAENCKSIADEITSIYATPDTRGKFVDYSNCDVFRQFSSKKKSADQANGSAGDIEEICVRSGKRKRRRSSFENDSE